MNEKEQTAVTEEVRTAETEIQVQENRTTGAEQEAEPRFNETIIENGLRGIVPERTTGKENPEENLKENPEEKPEETPEEKPKVNTEKIHEVNTEGNLEENQEENAEENPEENLEENTEGKVAAEQKEGEREANDFPEHNPEIPSEMPYAASDNSAGNSVRGITEKGKNVQTANTTVPARDYEAEWKELADAHPEVIGTTLPDDVFQACIKSDQPPLRVYESMMLQKMRTEVERLKQENERLRQNRDNAQRAPVTGTLEGGATGVKEEDAFIAAFKRYR